MIRLKSLLMSLNSVRKRLIKSLFRLINKLMRLLRLIILVRQKYQCRRLSFRARELKNLKIS